MKMSGKRMEKMKGRGGAIYQDMRAAEADLMQDAPSQEDLEREADIDKIERQQEADEAFADDMNELYGEGQW